MLTVVKREAQIHQMGHQIKILIFSDPDLALILAMISLLFRIFMGCLLLSIASCSPSHKNHISRDSTTNYTNSIAPDYSSLTDWAAHPDKKDVSDSVPGPLRSTYHIDTTVDVFFIHPTSLTDMSDNRWNAPVNDAAINAKTDNGSILYQASAFNEFRVFAPRYRQAHLRAYYTTDSAAAVAAFNIAYHDIKSAFEYYLLHHNNGRPIIIASHSQGSTHAQHLLKDFFDTDTLKTRLVAAYVIGMYIPNDYFTTLKMCKDSLQIGCLCGWRTFKKGYKPPFVKKENGTGLITNPLSWTVNSDPARHSLNKGSVLTRFNKINKHLTNAQIKDGILWIGRLHMPGGFLVRRKNFHIGDINLFYVNIREDLRRRVRLYWNK